jgi:hypothetical protein
MVKKDKITPQFIRDKSAALIAAMETLKNSTEAKQRAEFTESRAREQMINAQKEYDEMIEVIGHD